MAERVLLVDDEEEFLEVLAERMRSRGFHVTTATTAGEAIKLTLEKSFDAIVLDLMLPDKNGLEALKEMKNIKPELQVILLTGHATLKRGIDAMKFGAVDFLEKPADIKKLTEQIKKAGAKKMVLVEKKMEKKIQSILKSKGW